MKRQSNQIEISLFTYSLYFDDLSSKGQHRNTLVSLPLPFSGNIDKNLKTQKLHYSYHRTKTL